jgi:hypothetical protein
MCVTSFHIMCVASSNIMCVSSFNIVCVVNFKIVCVETEFQHYVCVSSLNNNKLHCIEWSLKYHGILGSTVYIHTVALFSYIL